MKKVKFYSCPNCGNIMYSIDKAEIACCGRKMEALSPKGADDAHAISISEIDNELYITIAHEMTKSHFISFAAYVSYDRVLLLRLYPEQNAELRIPKMHWGKLFLFCNQHGLKEMDLRASS